MDIQLLCYTLVMKKYNPKEIEEKWQRVWQKEKLYSPNLDLPRGKAGKAKKPFFNLMMFPYPSAEGLHVGNMYAQTGSDIYGRFKRMQGFDVFEPIGLDGFGIHSENYALKIGVHPMKQAKISEKKFYDQMHQIGTAVDWQRTVETYDLKYYKWTQWIFVQLFKKGLAYRKKSPVNYCPGVCKTVLADEQAEGGKCERCGTPVEKRDLEQWFFKITDYAERLLNNLSSIDWSERVKIAQRQWIGKKEGINIKYKIEGSGDKIICFTTRPDTNFGATFIVVGPEHGLINDLTKKEYKTDVRKYIEKSLKKSEAERISEGRKKTGVFTGSYAINNLNGEKLPIWISDFVLGNVGTGAVVGVPGHDIRDFEFAKEFKLPIIRVVVGKDGDKTEISKPEQVQEKEGVMINSEFLDGLDIHEATKKVMDHLEKNGWGKRQTVYHLRDWLISRQRYWGPPIPMIHCPKCGWQPVPEKDLPVLLPDVSDWKPMGTGKSPLASIESFVNTKCPNCGGPARRETDVSDTFLDSAWYFFRYISTEFDDVIFDQKRAKKWLPVHMYTGGAEHSVLHLLYARFITMVFKDMGLIDFEEPFTRFYAHGLLIKEGAKMSKSKGNIVVPDAYIKKYGADTLRTYLMFLGPFNQGGDFQDSGIEGVYKFLKRIWVLLQSSKKLELSSKSEKMMHKTIKRVTNDIESLRYNTAIAALMEWYNFLSKQTSVSKDEAIIYLKLLAPFAPHMSEELFHILNPKLGSIHTEAWPVFDEKYLVESEVTIAVQVNGKLRDTLKIQNAKVKKQKFVEDKARENSKVQKYLNKPVRKVIYVEGKIINFVI